MTGRRTDRASALLVPALTVAMTVLLWAATAGPPAVLSPSGRRRSAPSPIETSTTTPQDEGPRTLEELTRDVPATRDLGWLGELLAWAVLLTLGAAAVLLARYAWQHRWHRPEPPPDLPFDVLPGSTVARELAERLDGLVGVAAQGSPRNGIVLCWLALEEAVAEAGLPRSLHETSAEFTVRVLHRLDIDPVAIGSLAGLYREARFSDHPLGEDARTEARTALDRLRHDLRRAGAVR